MNYWQSEDSAAPKELPQKTMFLISAFFDPMTNRILQNPINGVAAVTGNEFMLANSVPPHLTLCQLQTRNQQQALVTAMQDLEQELKATISDAPHTPINLVSCGDGIPNVVFAKALPSNELRNLVELVHEHIAIVPEVRISPHYLPETIYPHITLGKTLTQRQQKDAMTFLQNQFSGISGHIAEIALTCGKPPQPVYRIKL
ncbi:MAG: 2'-5' RNA ligase family protein [Treponemataceae bacterium]|nr:2'-5' RNA ligase family protein [Treponemataceae bacterium]